MCHSTDRTRTGFSKIAAKMRLEWVKTDVGRMYEGIGLSIDKMLGNNLTADTASDTPVTGGVGVDWQEA